MLTFGFSPSFVSLIMKCVSSVRCTVRVNGELLPYFTPSRGFRQGDPVSPFLFLICAEGLTSLLNHYGSPHIDKGIRVSFRAPWVNLLLFADDSLIFISATQESADRLNAILLIYATCSGQAVNRDKSAIFFSPNTPHARRQAVKLVLGVHVEAFSDRYLGLPTAVGRITSETFDHIGDRSRSKMNGWAERLLACAERETEIKSVIQAIPTISMSCFRLTKKVCKGLIASMAKFWWSGSLDRRSMHWLSWEKLASPKCQGGMGFRDLELFNLALLGKHGWRFISNPNSLCAQVMKGAIFRTVISWRLQYQTHHQLYGERSSPGGKLSVLVFLRGWGTAVLSQYGKISGSRASPPCPQR